MLFVAGQVSMTARHLYTVVLWQGIITTALANAYGFQTDCSVYWSTLSGLSRPLPYPGYTPTHAELFRIGSQHISNFWMCRGVDHGRTDI